MLYGLYQPIADLDKFGLAILGSILVIIVSGLALKDNLDARGHLNRAAQIENEIAHWRPVPAPWWLPSGVRLLKSAILTTNILNGILLLKFLWPVLPFPLKHLP